MTLRVGWTAAFLVGSVLPSFLFLLGDVFDTFGGDTTPEEQLEGVGNLVKIMGGLAAFVFIASFLQHYFLSKGGVLVARRIRTAYLEAILR